MFVGGWLGPNPLLNQIHPWGQIDKSHRDYLEKAEGSLKHPHDLETQPYIMDISTAS